MSHNCNDKNISDPRHTSFDGMESANDKVKANALRRYLHYFAHECGHNLGLKHPFENGNCVFVSRDKGSLDVAKVMRCYYC